MLFTTPYYQVLKNNPKVSFDCAQSVPMFWRDHSSPVRIPDILTD